MTFMCTICSKTYDRNRHLRLHIARHHSDKSTWTDKCKICNKVYADPEILQRHAKTHFVKVPCPNDDCKQTFTTISAMHKHRRQYHLKDAQSIKKIKEYQCNECEVSFSKHHLLSQHMFTHTGVLPFKCGKCEKLFSTLAHRNRHEKIHNGYLCEKCGEKLETWSKLQAHVKDFHPRTFKCSKCDQVFKMACRLREHAHIHDEERKVFKCKSCSKTFVKKSNLKTHIRTKHLEEKPFKCEIDGCHKMFSYKHLLQRHMKIHQPDYTPNLLRSGKKKISLISRLTGIRPSCNDIKVKA